jgi:hypothetical protein
VLEPHERVRPPMHSTNSAVNVACYMLAQLDCLHMSSHAKAGPLAHANVLNTETGWHTGWHKADHSRSCSLSSPHVRFTGH